MKGIARDSVRMLYRGARIPDYLTPQDVNMKDGDIIDMMRAQTGD